MTLQTVDFIFKLIAFVFAISVHESAHAWTANRCGDPTARMLGRVSLNPIKHIDPIGTVLLPLISYVSHIPMLGWAKPTPVNPRNFKKPVQDDILTSVAGPVSNFLIATIAVVLLLAVSVTSESGRELVHGIPFGRLTDTTLTPFCLLLYEFMTINVVLGVFNLIPVPPLDGSHVLRHFLSPPVLRVYDTMGWIGLIALVYLGGGLLGKLIFPVLGFFVSILLRF